MELVQFKIQGPFEREVTYPLSVDAKLSGTVRSWCLWGQRSDGAVFWTSISVEPTHLLDRDFKDAFWRRCELAFSTLKRVAGDFAPKSAFVSLAKVCIHKWPDGSFVMIERP